MVWCGALVQIDMGLNKNQKLCGPLMVWEITKNGYDGADLVFRIVVVRLSGVRKSMEDQLCLILCVKLVVMRFGPWF